MKRVLAVILILMLLLGGCGQKAEPVEPAEPEPSWQELYDLGVRYLSEGNYEEAILAFSAAIEIDPGNAEGYADRGEAYLMLAETDTEADDHYRQAEADLKYALELGIPDPEVYRHLASIYTAQNAYEEAIHVYAMLLDSGYGTSQDREALIALTNLADEMPEDAGDGAPIQTEEEMKQSILAVMEVLHSCTQDEFCAEWDSSDLYQRTVFWEQGKSPVTSRLFKGKTELLPGEEYDPIGAAYFPVRNFQTKEELHQYLAGFISEDLFQEVKIGELWDFEEIDGCLYIIRGSQGYGAEGYNLETMQIVSFDETSCTVHCWKTLFDMQDTLMQLTFEKQNGTWLLTGIQNVN